MSNIIDSIKDFALADRRLFPCDTPSLIKASANAFESESSKLQPTEKVACARHITKKAFDLGVDIGASKAARLSGDTLNPMFKVAIGYRRDATAWDTKACHSIAVIEKLAESISQHKDNGVRRQLLDKLADSINSFDVEWDKNKTWRDNGIPDAVETVFLNDPVSMNVDTLLVGDRVVSKVAFDSLDKTAAAKALTPEAMKSAETWQSFKTATWAHQVAIAALLPSGE